MRSHSTKHTFALFLLLTLSASLLLPLRLEAQSSHETERSSSAPAPEVYDMTVDGVRVIVQPTKANQVIGVTLGLTGSYAAGETNNPAVPQATAVVTTASGSVKYPKDRYRSELSRLVTSIGSTADPHNMLYFLTCVRPKFNESWKIFEDVLKEPLYDPEEITKMREAMLAGIASRRQEPEEWANFMIDSIWGYGHRDAQVTEPADVNAVTVEAMKAFHDRILARDRMTIVVVGDVTKEEVEQKVHDLLADKPAVPPTTPRSAKEIERNAYGPGTSDVVTEQRTLPTTYIVGRFTAPMRTDPMFWPLRLASSILSDRLYEEVRTKRNLSYSPYATLRGRYQESFVQVGVSSTMPDSAMHVIMHELLLMRDSGVTEKELRDTKESFITSIYMAQQSNLAEASRLYFAQVETGNYRTVLHTVDDVMSVTDAEIRQAIAQYLHTIYWVAVGDAAHVMKSDFLFP